MVDMQEDKRVKKFENYRFGIITYYSYYLLQINNSLAY